MLRREGVIHSVLNAKFHQQEAEIVARAGQRGAVTISTNMAGRGTDIRLGSGVVELGGLHVIGTERHESRRIDRQLRGRCARQGDPGSSQFFVSFEDDLMRNFGGAGRMTKIMEKFGMQEDEELQHPWLSKSVEGAQKRVEQRNYVARKRTLEFDDVMNQQREVIYGYRNEAVETGDPGALVLEAVTGSIRRRVMEIFERTGKPDEGKGLAELIDWVSKTHPVKLSSGVEARQVTESRRWVVLSSVDRLWQDHLHAMDGLREAVHLRSIGQKDPLVEYKREAYSLFSGLMERIQDEISISAWRVAWAVLGDAQRSGNSPDTKDEARRPPDIIDLLLVRKAPRAGRNTVCPCGTGKKYKHCCGRVAA
jgi:preprotein translocase subunit SecA